jgi:hypothetical protein
MLRDSSQPDRALIVELPEWQPFASGTPPWIPDTSDAGRVVVLLAPPAARRDGWAVRLALDLVGAWGDAGRKVVLADGMLEFPMLHRELGVANAEGISDAALYGASVARVAHPVPGRAFFFVSAGSPSGDPDSVATSPRWARLLEGFKDAGVTLVLFLREGCAAEDGLTVGADDVVVLAGSGDDVPDGARRLGDRVRAVIGPEATPARDPGSEWAAATDDPADTSDGHSGPDPFGSIPEATSVGPSAVPETKHDGEGEDPQPPRASGGVDAWDLEGRTDAPEAGPDTVPPDVASGAVPSDALGHGGTSGPVTPAHMEHREGSLGPDFTVGEASHPVSEREATHVEPPAVGHTPTRPGRRRGGADPDARRKLMWVGLVVLVLVVLVILGALRSG